MSINRIAVIAGLAAAPALGQFVEPADIIQSFSGNQPGTFYGWAIAELDDLDNDGARELLISDVNYFKNPGDPGPSGRLVVVSSGSGDVLYDIIPYAGGNLGYGIGDVGDVNGDGVQDFAGGAPFRQGVDADGNPLPFLGAIEVYSGADGSLLRSLTPPQTVFPALGTSVAAAGDVNGDGFDDILGGAQLSGGGEAWVFSGADGSVLRGYSSGEMSGEFGAGAANAGDVNGDGFDDHLIGAPSIGKAFLYSGADGALIHEFAAPEGFSRYGEFFVDGLNDLNADGVRDIYIGDYAFDDDAATPGFPGAAFVYSGADGSLIHQIIGPTGSSGLGCGRNAGDIDDDGREDLLIGHYTSSEGAPGAGRVTAYSGADGSELFSVTGNIAGANLGFDCVGIGDVDGDGGEDFALSAATGQTVTIVAGLMPPCPADTNRDGKVNGKDVRDYLRLFFRADPAADLDDDFDVDLIDLVLFVESSIEGCN